MSPNEPPFDPPKRVLSRAEVLFFRGLGVAAVGLAAAGVVLPLLPTTPFLLVAVWAFARGSPELRARIYASRRFGPFLRDWDERGAIPVSGKLLAVAGMAAGFGVILWRSNGWLLPAVAGAVILGAGAFVLSRPS
jgi:uncharacterized membrane protein YbaN (DUF454 family)